MRWVAWATTKLIADPKVLNINSLQRLTHYIFIEPWHPGTVWCTSYVSDGVDLVCVQ
jgi:hypothetical protein